MTEQRTGEQAGESGEGEGESVESRLARLAEHDAREAAANEEAQAREQLAALQERFKVEPPNPMRHNEQGRSLAGKGRDDGSADWAYGQIAKTLGVERGKTSWP